jgi:HK97 family phage major capsid protein
MPDKIQPRLRAERALARMNTAHAAIEAAEPGADVDAHQRAFDAADQEHRLATAELQLADAGGSVRVNSESLTYRKDSPDHSWFRDVFRSKELHDPKATARLQRHAQEMEVEGRDLSSTDGVGGEFVAPLWLQEEFVTLARAGRPFANVVRKLPLPQGTDSVNIPRLATGTATAAQNDNAAVQETDATTDSIQAPVRTVAGQQDVSRQLLDRSVPGVDQVLLGDLAADYATKLDVQTLTGSGSAPNARGILNVSGIIAVTYTDASPTVPELYSKVADSIQQVHTNRFQSPSVIVMHPRRWGWFLAALDSQNRPLITPYAPQNSIALQERVGAENVVGSLQGLPVVVDASVPTNLGAGTNEDRIIVTRAEDVLLFEEDQPNQATYFEVLSGNLGVRLQVWGYFAFTGERYPKSTAVISGTGLVAPTF